MLARRLLAHSREPMGILQQQQRRAHPAERHSGAEFAHGEARLEAGWVQCMRHIYHEARQPLRAFVSRPPAALVSVSSSLNPSSQLLCVITLTAQIKIR
jgi:hypothetical protein